MKVDDMADVGNETYDPTATLVGTCYATSTRIKLELKKHGAKFLQEYINSKSDEISRISLQ